LTALKLRRYDDDDDDDDERIFIAQLGRARQRVSKQRKKEKA